MFADLEALGLSRLSDSLASQFPDPLVADVEQAYMPISLVSLCESLCERRR